MSHAGTSFGRRKFVRYSPWLGKKGLKGAKQQICPDKDGQKQDQDRIISDLQHQVGEYVETIRQMNLHSQVRILHSQVRNLPPEPEGSGGQGCLQPRHPGPEDVGLKVHHLPPEPEGSGGQGYPQSRHPGTEDAGHQFRHLFPEPKGPGGQSIQAIRTTTYQRGGVMRL